jgi:hypothetical protein
MAACQQGKVVHSRDFPSSKKKHAAGFCQSATWSLGAGFKLIRHPARTH